MNKKLPTNGVRYLAAMLFITSLMLAACGDSPTNTAAPATTAATTSVGSATTAATTTAANAATTATGAAANPAAGTVAGAAYKLNTSVSGKVDFWHFWGSPIRRNAIRRIVAVCQQQLPNIKITETFKPFGDIYTANTAAVAAGSGMPDVIVEDRLKLPQTAANNIETNLQKYATRDSVDGKAYWPFAWQQTLYNNETYGLPFETDIRVLYYSKNAFKEAGLDPEKPPKTWAELEDYANKLDKKNGDGTYSRIGFAPQFGIGWDLGGYLNGSQLVKDGKPYANDPKIVETLNWFKKWSDRYGGWGAFQKFKGQFSSAPNDPFMSGKVAMLVDINGYMSQLNFFRPQIKNADGKNEALDWAISDIPNNGTKASSSGGFALSIPRGSKNADAAWEVIKCASNNESSWGRDTYSMPANVSAANDPVLLADPNWKFTVDAMSYGKPVGGPYVKEYPNWGEQVDKRTTDFYEGKADAKTTLDQAQQAIEAEIAKSK